jgi:hypothetical protein
MAKGVNVSFERVDKNYNIHIRPLRLPTTYQVASVDELW